MRKLILLTLLVFSIHFLFAQSPAYFNYQAVIRDNAGELLKNKDVSFKISVIPGIATGNAIYEEKHAIHSNDYGICNLEIGNGANQTANFSTIDWSIGNFYLKIELDENAGSDYKDLGTIQLLSVPFSMHSNTASLAKFIDNDIIYFSDSDTLFAVKDREGNIVFAVFPDGAEIYVNETAKGKVGGFAISGRSPSKGIDEDYFVVTPDSTRVYVNQNMGKGKVGGFAISGRSPSKSAVENFMDLTPENYFIGHGSGKSLEMGQYNSFYGYNAGLNLKKGFSNIFIGYQSGYNTDTASYNVFIGQEAGKNNTKGDLNVFIGNQTGLDNTTGGSNTFIGNWSGIRNTSGQGNSFYGTTSGVKNESGGLNTFIGNSAGYNNIDGSGNFAGGYISLYNFKSGDANVALGGWSANNVESGNYNVYIGASSASDKTAGNKNVFVGALSGTENADGEYNVFIGCESGKPNTGSNNVFIGYMSGYYETESNRLHISNKNTETPLIYGEFDNALLKINGTLDVSSQPSKPKIYSQTDEPNIPNDTQAFWVDTDDSNRYYLILDVGGTQKKLELL